MRDLAVAKKTLTGSVTCALVKGKSVYVSSDSGIKPMMRFIAQGFDLRGFSAADKVVGKAAAALFLYAGVKAVYGEVMSAAAEAFLTAHGVMAKYKVKTDCIINRAGTGPCPMELAVEGAETPEDAYRILYNKIQAEKRAG